jgi:hypothetical protein
VRNINWMQTGSSQQSHHFSVQAVPGCLVIKFLIPSSDTFLTCLHFIGMSISNRQGKVYKFSLLLLPLCLPCECVFQFTISIQIRKIPFCLCQSWLVSVAVFTLYLSLHLSVCRKPTFVSLSNIFVSVYVCFSLFFFFLLSNGIFTHCWLRNFQSIQLTFSVFFYFLFSFPFLPSISFLCVVNWNWLWFK